MRLTPPKKAVFLIAALLAVLGLVSFLVPAIVFFAGQSFGLAFLGWLLLAAGNYLSGF